MDEIIPLATELIRFKTTADRPGEIRKCADFIAARLAHPAIVLKTFEKNQKISIVATLQDTKTPEIFLNAHFDVVPASVHLFEPRIIDGNLYGRGSDDCKVPTATLITLLLDFARRGERPDIGILLTSDEEVYGENGAGHVLSELGYACKFALVADGGDDFTIVTKHKGVLQVRISTIGRSAHSSRYWEGGENAVESLMRAYRQIGRMFPKLTKAKWKTTAALTKISGGDALNKIPDYAELYLDIRRTEKDSEQAILQKLASLKGATVEKVAGAEMLNTAKSDLYVQKLKKSAEKILKRSVKIGTEHGATDARYFSRKGIPAVLFKQMGAGAHSDSEHCIISSIDPFYRILKEFCAKKE